MSAFSLLVNRGSEMPTLPGYCGLSEVGRDNLLTTGTMMNAIHNTPSLIDTFLEFSETTDIQLKHQIGGECKHVDEIFLQIKADDDSDNHSSNHIFATLTIRRL